MVDWHLYYVFANIVSILIFGVMLAHDFLRLDRQETQIKFDNALISFVIYFIFDIFWALIEAEALPKTVVSSAVINLLIFIATGWLTYSWLRYIMAVEHFPSRNKPETKLACISAFLITTLVLVVAYVINPDYIINDKFELQPLYFYCNNIVAYLYIGSILIIAIKKAIEEKNSAEKYKHLLVGLLPFSVILGGLIEIILYPHFPIFCSASAILMLIFYIHSLEERVSLDHLTKLNNRGQLEQYMYQENSNPRMDKETYVLMMDINDFKHINDTYGHAEGDVALKLTSKALKKVAGATSFPVFVSRYGGDEFALIAHTDNQEEIEKFIEDIRNEIKEDCKKENLSYTITMAIGYNKLVKDGNDTLQKCLERADHNLYIDKKEYKKNR
jgi:diguanylate cyclase (GGDEF)-like protein